MKNKIINTFIHSVRCVLFQCLHTPRWHRTINKGIFDANLLSLRIAILAMEIWDLVLVILNKVVGGEATLNNTRNTSRWAIRQDQPFELRLTSREELACLHSSKDKEAQ
jgi:hypothetical protein